MIEKNTIAQDTIAQYYTLLFLLTADETPKIRNKHHNTLEYTAEQNRIVRLLRLMPRNHRLCQEQTTKRITAH